MSLQFVDKVFGHLPVIAKVAKKQQHFERYYTTGAMWRKMQRKCFC